MNLTSAEKLILIMLAELHERLEIDEKTAGLIKGAIYSDNTWALSWELSGIIGESQVKTPPEVSLVADILDMWQHIEGAYEDLNDQERKELEEKADPFGTHVRFSGFDGNNEPRYFSIASFLIQDMNRFTHFSGRRLNSHSPVIDSYQRMLGEFLKVRPDLICRNLSVDEMAEILNAQRIG